MSPRWSLLLCFAAGCAAPAAPTADAPLVARTYIAAPYEQVWRAVATAEGYEAWHSAPCREFGAAPGEPCVWGTDERETYRGEVTGIAADPSPPLHLGGLLD